MEKISFSEMDRVVSLAAMIKKVEKNHGLVAKYISVFYVTTI